MTIAIIGHGYVGLLTAAIFADLGNTVWCVGRTKEKIKRLNQGKVPFFEPGLAEALSTPFLAHSGARRKLTPVETRSTVPLKFFACHVR